MAVPLVLSNTRPDFESLLLQLQLYLASSEAWIDLQTSGTGETLLEMMAGVGAMNQFGVEAAFRETSLLNARRASSIYAIARMLGVRISRKDPAGVTVKLEREDSSTTQSLPAYTQFQVNGENFFNRNTLMFAQGSAEAAERVFFGPVLEIVSDTEIRLELASINVVKLRLGDKFNLSVNSGPDYGKFLEVRYVGGNVGDDLFEIVDGEIVPTQDAPRVSLLRQNVKLYEGTIVTEEFLSDGSGFRQLYLNPKNFEVSDRDTLVYVRSIEGVVEKWDQIMDGIWAAGSMDRVYFDTTSGYGETIISFGDSIHGASPTLGSTIIVKYVTTNGSIANRGFASLKIQCSDYSWVSGITTSMISGGADEKPSSFYRVMAPYIFSARRRAVTDMDYTAACLSYPGIVSAKVLAQRDIAPHDLRWMNQVQICLLPADVGVTHLTVRELDEVDDYLAKRKHAAVRIVHKLPTEQQAELDLTLALKLQYTPSEVLPTAEASVRALFARQPDTLGRRIAISDIVRAIKHSAGVDYVTVNKCKLLDSTTLIKDLLPSSGTHFITLSSLVLNTVYSEREIYEGES